MPEKIRQVVRGGQAGYVGTLGSCVGSLRRSVAGWTRVMACSWPRKMSTGSRSSIARVGRFAILPQKECTDRARTSCNPGANNASTIARLPERRLHGSSVRSCLAPRFGQHNDCLSGCRRQARPGSITVCRLASPALFRGVSPRSARTGALSGASQTNPSPLEPHRSQPKPPSASIPRNPSLH